MKLLRRIEKLERLCPRPEVPGLPWDAHFAKYSAVAALLAVAWRDHVWGVPPVEPDLSIPEEALFQQWLLEREAYQGKSYSAIERQALELLTDRELEKLSGCDWVIWTYEDPECKAASRWAYPAADPDSPNGNSPTSL